MASDVPKISNFMIQLNDVNAATSAIDVSFFGQFLNHHGVAPTRAFIKFLGYFPNSSLPAGFARIRLNGWQVVGAYASSSMNFNALHVPNVVCVPFAPSSTSDIMVELDVTSLQSACKLDIDLRDQNISTGDLLHVQVLTYY